MGVRQPAPPPNLSVPIDQPDTADGWISMMRPTVRGGVVSIIGSTTHPSVSMMRPTVRGGVVSIIARAPGTTPSHSGVCRPSTPTRLPETGRHSRSTRRQSHTP